MKIEVTLGEKEKEKFVIEKTLKKIIEPGHEFEIREPKKIHEEIEKEMKYYITSKEEIEKLKGEIEKLRELKNWRKINNFNLYNRRR
ncbi:MAG: hypothetical protein ABIN15_07925 [candidate division WOR-3 bacterium]